MDKEKNRGFFRFALVLIIILLFVITFSFIMIGKIQVPLPIVKQSPFFSHFITGQDVYGHVFIEILPQCTFDLGNGWTLFSLCADPDNKTVDGVASNTSYRYVMRWNTTRMEWDIYSPRSADKPFENFTTNESYFILLYSPYDLSVYGPANPDMNITMVQGWDAPSWPYLFSTNVTKYFDDTKHRYMMKWDNPIQEFIIYSPRAADKPFEKIFKAEGQMIYAYNNHTLIYNKTDLQDP